MFKKIFFQNALFWSYIYSEIFWDPKNNFQIILKIQDGCHDDPSKQNLKSSFFHH